MSSPKKGPFGVLKSLKEHPGLIKQVNNPWIAALAVFMLIQPVVATSIDLVHGYLTVKEELNPSERPIMRGEFDLLNQLITERNNETKKDIERLDKKIEKLTDQLLGIETPPITEEPRNPNESNESAIKEKLKKLQEQNDEQYKKRELPIQQMSK